MNLKKTNILLLLISVLSFLVAMPKAYAGTDKIRTSNYISGNYYYEHVRGNETFYEQSKFIIRNSDGAFVYCVQPFVKITDETGKNLSYRQLNMTVTLKNDADFVIIITQ